MTARFVGLQSMAMLGIHMPSLNHFHLSLQVFSCVNLSLNWEAFRMAACFGHGIPWEIVDIILYCRWSTKHGGAPKHALAALTGTLLNHMLVCWPTWNQPNFAGLQAMVIIGVLSNFNHFQRSCKFSHVRPISGHFQNKQHILPLKKCIPFSTAHLFFLRNITFVLANYMLMFQPPITHAAQISRNPTITAPPS